MSIKVGEVGKIIRLNADFDLSGSSDLKLNFKKPDNTILTVDSVGGVTAPPVDASEFNANEYWEYATKSGDIDQQGQWFVWGEYIDPTPKEFCGDPVPFSVLPCGA